jgi:hypothetical protein
LEALACQGLADTRLIARSKQEARPTTLLNFTHGVIQPNTHSVIYTPVEPSMSMTVSAVIVETDDVIPLMAALPYEIAISDPDVTAQYEYDPHRQLTIFSKGPRDYSTSRCDESIWSIFETKSDTKKDD